ncbi:MAG: imidazole glycerol phosphate synthase subunit HisH [Bacteroidales bacterium]|nr:imidazole glycerol phosphate synthase subunit HisH [Bacteroidales bacterium]
MIAIVNYGVGNIRSVVNALRREGVAEPIYTDNVELLRSADKVILPGVGEASTAMRALCDCGLADIIPTLTQPVLGICVGAQLMCRSSEEGDAVCMGIFDTAVRKFLPQEGLKIPHMGWNAVTGCRSALFKDIAEGSYVYYVHSYYPEICGDTACVTTHGIPFSGALCRDNFYACQFHPEKSGAVGSRIIRNFLDL